MRLRHPPPHLRDQRENNESGDGMANKSRDDKDQCCKDDDDAVEAHALYFLRDRSGDGVQKPRTRDSFAEGKAAGGEDDDGPEEVIEVFFSEDAGSEEEDDGDDGHDAHISKDLFELVGYAPDHDGDDRHGADEPLHTGEFVLHRPDGNDGGAFTGLERDEQ